ncbi:hypothetical protein KR054_005430, partial [Drosophila jambulina]
SLTALMIFFGLLALAIAASLGPLGSDVTTVCQSEDELWGDEDIRNFYFCVDGEVIADHCEEGYYFVNNATVSGCLPEDLMNPSCVNSVAKVPACTDGTQFQPQPASNLTNFYVCTNEGVKELPCASGKAFVDAGGYLGCFPWTQWRSLRNCSDN